jgi:hypothetical protein
VAKQAPTEQDRKPKQMRRTTIAMLALGVLAVAGCGNSSTFANKPRPAVPVNITVYLNDTRVAVSPSSVGAGPVVLIVTNQASQSESLTVLPPGGSQPLADTGPISPQATAQVTVDLNPGDYTISTARNGATDAELAASGGQGLQPATLYIGPPRPSSSNELLQP